MTSFFRRHFQSDYKKRPKKDLKRRPKKDLNKIPNKKECYVLFPISFVHNSYILELYVAA